MSATNNFFDWFYTGLNGLGGWFVFFVIALISTIWLLYDSQRRSLSVGGWRMAIVLITALMLPAIIARVGDYQTSLMNFQEAIFYLGLLGGIIPPVLAFGYYLSFQDEVMSQDPPISYGAGAGSGGYVDEPPTDLNQQGGSGKISSRKAKANAWLSYDGGSFQLNQGKSSIGRASGNDMLVTSQHGTVSKRHARIEEKNNHFTLIDQGSTNKTFVNGKKISQQVLLHSGDEIRFGDTFIVRFTAN